MEDRKKIGQNNKQCFYIKKKKKHEKEEEVVHRNIIYKGYIQRIFNCEEVMHVLLFYPDKQKKKLI